MLKRLWLIVLAVFVLSGYVSKINTQDLTPQQKTVTNLNIERGDVEKSDTHIVEVNQLLKDKMSIKTVEDEVEETNEKIDKYKDYIEVNIIISHYSSMASENGKWGAVDAMSTPLKYGTIAIPRDLPLGTKFVIDGYDGEFEGRDRGNKKYIKWIDENTMKIDLFIPRNKGENDKQYRARLMKLGIKKTTGRYLVVEK